MFKEHTTRFKGALTCFGGVGGEKVNVNILVNIKYKQGTEAESAVVQGGLQKGKLRSVFAWRWDLNG